MQNKHRAGFFVLADGLLDEVFSNIYSNSVKYTEGKQVYIQTSVEDRDRFWLVSITDNGRGIPDVQEA